MASPLDHAEHVAGILSLVAIAVIAGSGALATAVIAISVGPQWRRILRLASGHIEQLPLAAPVDSSHRIDADPQLRALGAGAQPTAPVGRRGAA